MQRNFGKIRLVVVQPQEQVYFDKYYKDPLVALEKFNYFCRLAKIGYEEDADFVMTRADKYNEMSAYFPHNEVSDKNQSGFIQVSVYFEVS